MILSLTNLERSTLKRLLAKSADVIASMSVVDQEQLAEIASLVSGDESCGENGLPPCNVCDDCAADDHDFLLSDRMMRLEDEIAPTTTGRDFDCDPTHPEACPGCGCLPGEGVTPGCTDKMGCAAFVEDEPSQVEVECVTCNGVVATSESIRIPFHCNECAGVLS